VENRKPFNIIELYYRQEHQRGVTKMVLNVQGITAKARTRKGTAKRAGGDVQMLYAF